MPAEPLLDDLVKETILEHYRKPRRRGVLPSPTLHVEGMNPVCGDEVLLDLLVDDGVIREIAFSGAGCSISQASASMMADEVRGASLDGARGLLASVREMFNTHTAPATDIGDIASLEGVAKFPVRVKCALLCWNVLEGGLNQLASATEPGPATASATRKE